MLVSYVKEKMTAAAAASLEQFPASSRIHFATVNALMSHDNYIGKKNIVNKFLYFLVIINIILISKIQ